MAIYLDTNILYSWRTFAELDRVGLSIVARQTRQLVLLPWLVEEEARGHYVRSLEEPHARLDAAVREVNRVFDDQEDVFIEPTPDVDEQVSSWQERLNSFVQVLPAHPDDAVEALRREVWGIAPARRVSGKPGVGGRDAAIWLAIARDHSTRDEDGHFITMDGGFSEDGGLRPPMESDITATKPLVVHRGIASFLEILGTADEVQIDLSDLSDAKRSVKVVMEAALHIPRAIFKEAYEDRRYHTEVTSAEPTQVTAARRYERGGDSLTVADSEWLIRANLYHQERDSEPDLWCQHEDIELRGNVQLYLPSGDNPNVLPQIISARLKSDYSVFIRDDGTVVGLQLRLD